MTRPDVVPCALAALVTSAPAGAGIGADPVAPETVPWFTSLGCGGSLVAKLTYVAPAFYARPTRNAA